MVFSEIYQIVFKISEIVGSVSSLCCPGSRATVQLLALLSRLQFLGLLSRLQFLALLSSSSRYCPDSRSSGYCPGFPIAGYIFVFFSVRLSILLYQYTYSFKYVNFFPYFGPSRYCPVPRASVQSPHAPVQYAPTGQ